MKSVACTRPPVSRQISQVSTVPKSSSPVPSALPGARNMVEQPFDLWWRKSRRRYADRCSAEHIPRSRRPAFFRTGGGAPALPDDGVINRAAGFPVPDDGGFPLVGDADGGDGGEGGCCFPQHPVHHLHLGVIDLLGVMLDPTGPWDRSG